MADTFIKNLNRIGNNVKQSLNLYGAISSIGKGGKTVNIQNVADGEIRELKVIAPYGISSSAVAGVASQSIVNDNNNNVVVGVYDKNKPDVNPGDVIIYSSGGAQIKLLANGDIHIKGKHIYFEEL